MRKPRKAVVKDSWDNMSSLVSSSYVCSEVHSGDNGPCLSVTFQGDMYTNDVHLDIKGAKKLIAALNKQVTYLKFKQGAIK